MVVVGGIRMFDFSNSAFCYLDIFYGSEACLVCNVISTDV